MGRFLIVLLTGLSVTLAFAAPTHAQKQCGNGGQIAGAVIGGLLGGFLGNRIDGGKKRSIGTLLGGGLGAFVGSQIGKALDTCEQEKMAKATKSALDSNTSGDASQQIWQSETRENVSGVVKATPPEKLADGRICRNATRVNYVDGQEMQDAPRFCRTPPDTSWVAA